MKQVADVLRSVRIWTAGTSLVVFWIPLLAVIRLFDRDPLHLRTARWFRRLGRALTRINPWRIHISGWQHFDPSRVYVIVSNHQSLADIPVITHIRIDAKWLAKAELFRLPGVGWMLRMAGDVPVERDNRRQGGKALLQCARYLRKRCSVVFFPEGTRSPGGEVLEFSEGPFQLAIREQVPVLPLVVEGSGSVLPPNSWMFSGARDIYLRILEAVPVEGWSVKQSGLLRDAVRQKIVDELESMRGGFVGPPRQSVAENAPATS